MAGPLFRISLRVYQRELVAIDRLRGATARARRAAARAAVRHAGIGPARPAAVAAFPRPGPIRSTRSKLTRSTAAESWSLAIVSVY